MNKDIYISEDDCTITRDDMSIAWDFPETPAMMEGEELHFTWTPSRYL